MPGSAPLTFLVQRAMILDMPTVFFIAGLVVTLIGVVMVLLARIRPPAPPATESIGDIGKVLEEFRKVLELIDKQYRIGVIVMAVGLALVGTGAYLEARDAKDEAERGAAAAFSRPGDVSNPESASQRGDHA